MPPTKHTIAATHDAIMSNGHPKKLLQLLDYHQRAVDAIRATLELLDADAHESSQRRIATTIRTAQVIDAVRQARGIAPTDTPPAKRGRPRKTEPSPWQKKKANRAKTAAMLATLDPTEPKLLSNPRASSVLLLHGFIRKKGSGYVRTSKEFHP